MKAPQESVAGGSVDASSVTSSAVASCPRCEALSESRRSLFLDVYSRVAKSYFPLSILLINYFQNFRYVLYEN